MARAQKTAQAQKKTRERTCIVCGQSLEKGELVRFVRSRDGGVSVDATGRAPGRGAYICPKHECFSACRKRNKLASALRVSLSPDAYDVLEPEFDRLCDEQGEKRD